VAYTSLYETFGLPVLEALGSGCPLVASNRGAIPEVAGDAARLVDPEDVQSIASGIADVLLDSALSARLRDAGPRRTARFTWERCAQETAAVLQQALERRRRWPAATSSLPVHPPVLRDDPP
jgi:glycosyltransferase involved in cell wall biosynthesis